MSQLDVDPMPQALAASRTMLEAAEVVVVADGPVPGPDAVAVAREIAHRLDADRPGRVVLLAHTPTQRLSRTGAPGSSDPEPVAPQPIPAHWIGPLLRTWAERGLDWTQQQGELAAVRRQVALSFGAASLRSVGVAVASGRVRMLDGGRLSLDRADAGTEQSQLLTPQHVVLATGATPAVPDVSGIGETRLHLADSVLDLPRRPESVVVFGGGAHGCELAQGLARLGSTVTLIEPGPRLLADLPDAAAQVVVDALRDNGVRMICGARLASVAPTLDGGAWVGIDPGGDVAAEAFVLATGRRARSSGLDLAAAGVEVGTAGQVLVDDRLRAAPGVFACGEATGMLIYGASPAPMARIAAANVLSGSRRGSGMSYEPPIPVRVLRTDPEVAVVGQVRDLPVGAVQGVGEGPAEGATVQLVVARAGGHRRSLLGRSANWVSSGHSGRVLIGAVLAGAGAAEAAGQLVLAVTAGLPAATLIDIDAPDRTWAAAIQTCMARTLAEP